MVEGHSHLQKVRNAALSTPRLWATVKLTNIECFAVQLSRVGSIPIRVEDGDNWDLDWLELQPTREEHPITLLAELLWRNMHRVGKLSMAVSSFLCKVLSKNTSITTSDAPHLRSLTLFWTGPQGLSMPSWALPVLSSVRMPKLTHLVLQGSCLQAAYA